APHAPARLCRYVSPLVMRDLVLRAPEPLVRGREDEHAAAGFQHAPKFPQSRGVVIEVFEHIERCHEVELAVVERESTNVGIADVLQSAIDTELKSLLRDDEPLNSSQALKDLDHKTHESTFYKLVQDDMITITIPMARGDILV